MRRPARQCGDQAGRAHHARPLDRRAGAGERHVEGDERERHQQPGAQRRADERPRGEHQRGQQHHVLAADREHVGQPGALELVAHVVREALVLAEDHAAQQRGLVVGQAVYEARLGAPPDHVHESRDAAASLADAAERGDLERGARPAASLVGVEQPERRDSAPHRDDLAHLRAGPIAYA